MELNRDGYYRILEARDARFDGLFFVGVSSTGIYCRCVCPVRPPKRENCTYYQTAAQAEEAGFRPCMRCRPENAPGSSSVDALKSRARKAAKLIENGALDEQTLETFADSLGVSGRQLRRAMQQELGVAPLQYALTCRLLNAKRLLADTNMPIGEVALASGFQSLRRFNDSFQKRYRLSPSELRRKRIRSKDHTVTCEISFRPPFEWESLLEFLDQRKIQGVEHVEGNSYARSAEIGDHRGWFRVGMSDRPNSVRITLSDSLCPVMPKLIYRVRRVFDLDADPVQIANALGPLVGANPGLRLPGAFDGFEAAVRAILGQQVTVKFATQLAGRIAATFGTPIESDQESIQYLFPSASRLADCSQDDIARLGVIGSRARAIVALARALTNGLRLNPFGDYEHTKSRLLEIPGVGAWTAEYICMRALGYPDAFPAEDAGIYRSLRVKDPKSAATLVEQYRPWRSYAVMHLWHGGHEQFASQGNALK